jgi:outer membrane protein TolC
LTLFPIFVETEDALTAFSREQEARGILEKAVATGRRAADISKRQYALGLVDFLSVLQAKQAFHQSQEQLVQSEARLAPSTWWRCIRALGGSWQSRGEEKASTGSEK